MNVQPLMLQRLRKEYQPGTRVQLLEMADPYSKLEPGVKGTVRHIDDIGTIHVSWDTGSTLGILYGVDKCLKIEQ